MKVITEDAVLVCGHLLGKVKISITQEYVTVGGRKIMIEPDPVGKSISSCPNIGVGIKPCTSTLRVVKGYCDFIKIGGKRICMDTLEGVTDGTPPGMVKYLVKKAGQEFMEVK
jgi:hypothetical protein